MALVKSNSPAAVATAERGVEALLTDLSDAASGVRRGAARDLAAHPAAAMALCDQLEVETAPSVLSTIMTSLIVIDTPEVASRLASYLRSDDTKLRNIAIEALQEMPDTVIPLLENLLDDEDADVRIFAVNILAVLRHNQAPERLAQVIRNDTHINVCAAAVDGLAEVGGPEQVADLRDLASRFPDNLFLRFAVDTAIRRMDGE